MLPYSYLRRSKYMTTKIFAVAGGDLRQIYVAKSLAADGHKVRIFGFDNYSNM